MLDHINAQANGTYGLGTVLSLGSDATIDLRDSDLTGNTLEWTSSASGQDLDDTEFPYPYDADDGREETETTADMLRVSRGGSWPSVHTYALAPFRDPAHPGRRNFDNGVRVVVVGSASLVSPGSGS